MPDNAQKVSLLTECEPRLFLFLVNYLSYPKNFDLTGRTITVIGKTNLSFEHSPPDSSRDEQQAIIYVPERDREYDLVYVHLASGSTYKVPFTTMHWQRVTEERMPHAVRILATK